MSAQPKGLGKGLSALMNDNYTNTVSAAPASAPAAAATPVEGITTLPLASLVAGKYQPRQHFDDSQLAELSESISKHGIMQPIVVRALAPNRYEIIAGERRFRAAKLANLKDVPVIIRDVADQQALELALVENIQRADLNPLEEATGYQRLMEEFNYTQDALSKIVGKSRSHIANLLRLLGLPEKYRTAIDKGELTMGHARALLSAKDQDTLFALITQEGISVRQAEEWIQTEKGAPASARKQGKEQQVGTNRGAGSKDQDVMQIEQMLAENLGLKVSITPRGAQSGSVTIQYESLSQLDDVLRRLGGGA
jgi:ParB family chromosome partitioning protein